MENGLNKNQEKCEAHCYE